MNLAVLSLPLIPLTWAYAILRYRLMDVDIIFQEGYVYTLATLCVVGVFYGLIFSVSGPGDLSGTAMVAMILIAAFVFQPIRNWIQEQLDRYYFYKDRYDYRRTLIEFARELGSPTDLDEMLETRGRPADPHAGHPARGVLHHGTTSARAAIRQLELASNRQGKQTEPGSLRSGSELLRDRSPTKPYLFFERTRNMLDVVSHDWPAGGAAHDRRAGSDLLSAVLGARTDHRVSGREPHRYPAIFCRATTSNCWSRFRAMWASPIDNAMLYRSLATQGRRVRTPEGILGKYRRIHPRRHPGGRSRRTRRKLESADGEAYRHRTRRRRWDALCRSFCETDLYEELDARGGRRRHSQHL